MLEKFSIANEEKAMFVWCLFGGFYMVMPLLCMMINMMSNIYIYIHIRVISYIIPYLIYHIRRLGRSGSIKVDS